MKPPHIVVEIAVSLLWLAVLNGCTSNPFRDDDSSSGATTIQGTVQLNDGSSPEGAYVWLEGFKLGRAQTVAANSS